VKRILTFIPALLGWAFAVSAAPEVGQPAPDFTATDISGQTLHLSDYKGTIVVMETYDSRDPRTFWEYKSGTMSLVQHFLASNGVVYLVVDPGTDGVTPARAKWEMANRQMQITDWIIDGPGIPLTQLYGLTAIGQMFVIDQAGVLAYAGAFDDTPDLNSDPRTARNYVLRSVKELLAAKKVSIAQTPLLETAFPISSGLQIGQRAPDFIATDIDGKMLRLSDYAGKVVVLEAYKSVGCPGCESHYRSGVMQELQRQCASNGVVWLLVDFDAPHLGITPEKARRERAERKMTVTDYILDADGSQIGLRYAFKFAPGAVVIARDGTVAFHGAMSDIAFLARIACQDWAHVDGPDSPLCHVPMEELLSGNYVQNVVQALLANQRPPVTQTAGYGCPLPFYH
jgi:peroxiredoxin